MIEGNVTGGIILAIPPKDNSTTNNDEDGDGIEDAKEGSAQVSNLRRGAGHGCRRDRPCHRDRPGCQDRQQFRPAVIDGIIAGNGVYAGVDANGLVIGGRGGAVTIANGIECGRLNRRHLKRRQRHGPARGFGRQCPGNPRFRARSGPAEAAPIPRSPLPSRSTLGALSTTIRNSGLVKAIAGGEGGTAIAISTRAAA